MAEGARLQHTMGLLRSNCTLTGDGASKDGRSWVSRTGRGESATLAAVTRRDPTIVARVWPVAEAFTALILVDQLAMHLGYRALAQMD